MLIDAVDLRGVCLDDIVSIEKGCIQVYGLPGGAAKPVAWSGLSGADITSKRSLYIVLEPSMALYSDRPDHRFEEPLLLWCAYCRSSAWHWGWQVP